MRGLLVWACIFRSSAERGVLRGGLSTRRLGGVTVTGTPYNGLRGLPSPLLRLLPDLAVDLFERLQAASRLAAHLRLVHDAVCQLADSRQARATRHWATTTTPCCLVLQHCIGQVAFPGEIPGPGAAHEEAGGRLLLLCGAALTRPTSQLPVHPETASA
jgi:hypothetical protein